MGRGFPLLGFFWGVEISKRLLHVPESSYRSLSSQARELVKVITHPARSRKFPQIDDFLESMVNRSSQAKSDVNPGLKEKSGKNESFTKFGCFFFHSILLEVCKLPCRSSQQPRDNVLSL